MSTTTTTVPTTTVPTTPTETERLAAELAEKRRKNNEKCKKYRQKKANELKTLQAENIELKAEVKRLNELLQKAMQAVFINQTPQ